MGRKTAFKILHAYCGATDSLRILMLKKVLDEGGLSEKEWGILTKRYVRIQKDTAFIRKMTNVMEKRHASK